MTAASKIVERWTRAVSSNEKKLARATKAGKPERIAKLEKVLNRQRGWLRGAEEKLLYELERDRAKRRREKLERDELKVIDRRAEKLLPQATALTETINGERRRQRFNKVKNAAELVDRQDVTVDSPYGREHGVDAVVRIFHTIESMRKRHQIDDRQKMAADRYRWSFETCPSTIRCALDVSGRGGGTSEIRSPTENQRQAVEWLLQAETLLGKTDSVVIRLVCGEGEGVEVVARRYFSTPSSRRPSGNEVSVIGDRLRTGLTVLADHWWPERRQMRKFMEQDARPSSAQPRDDWDPKQFKGRVAHATAGVVYGFEAQEGHADLRLKPVRAKRARRGEARQ